MGFFNRLFGGDAGIIEAMHETSSKLQFMHPSLEEHEILALVLHCRYKKLSPEIGLMIAVLFPRIEILTEWVVGLENSGGPRRLNEYISNTTTAEERENALKYIEKKALEKTSLNSKLKKSNLEDFKVSEDIVDQSADILWNKFEGKLNYDFDEDAKPLDHLSEELRNTAANIYYRYFQFCSENPNNCKDIEEKIERIKRNVEQQKNSWESHLEAILTLTLEAFQNNTVGEYAAINHALEYLAEIHGHVPSGVFRSMDDSIIAVLKYKIPDAFSRTGASLAAECKMREGESDEIQNLMHYFEYSWGYHFNNPYQS